MKDTGFFICHHFSQKLHPIAYVVTTLDRHRNGLLAYFDHRISTGPLEGLNNKIKVFKRQLSGLRDMEYFKLRLFFIHEDPLTLAG